MQVTFAKIETPVTMNMRKPDSLTAQMMEQLKDMIPGQTKVAEFENEKELIRAHQNVYVTMKALGWPNIAGTDRRGYRAWKGVGPSGKNALFIQRLRPDQVLDK